jgi:hypothetical protein
MDLLKAVEDVKRTLFVDIVHPKPSSPDTSAWAAATVRRRTAVACSPIVVRGTSSTHTENVVGR